MSETCECCGGLTRPPTDDGLPCVHDDDAIALRAAFADLSRGFEELVRAADTCDAFLDRLRRATSATEAWQILTADDDEAAAAHDGIQAALSKPSVRALLSQTAPKESEHE